MALPRFSSHHSAVDELLGVGFPTQAPPADTAPFCWWGERRLRNQCPRVRRSVPIGGGILEESKFLLI